MESKIDLETRTIKARAKIPNLKGDLIPGSFAKVEIILEQLPHAIVVPSESVIPELSGEKVFICVNGKVRSMPGENRHPNRKQHPDSPRIKSPGYTYPNRLASAGRWQNS